MSKAIYSNYMCIRIGRMLLAGEYAYINFFISFQGTPAPGPIPGREADGGAVTNPAKAVCCACNLASYCFFTTSVAPTRQNRVHHQTVKITNPKYLL